LSKRAGGRGRVPADKGHRIWWFLFGLAGLGMGVWVFRRKRKGHGSRFDPLKVDDRRGPHAHRNKQLHAGAPAAP